MRIPAKAKPEKLASTDQTRPVLASLWLRIEGDGESRQGWLEGTDSYKLGRVPVELSEGDTEGFVPVEALVNARKLKCDEIACNGSLELRAHGSVVATYPRPDVGQWPNTPALLELEPARIEGYAWRIGLNPKLLLDLAMAIGAETVELEFTASRPAPGPDGGSVDFNPSNLRPVRVTAGTMLRGAEDTADGFGILMPVRVKD